MLLQPSTYLRTDLVAMQLLHSRASDALLGLLPLGRLIQFQTTVRQITGCASTFICTAAGRELATGVAQLAEEIAIGVVEDVDCTVGLRHVNSWQVRLAEKVMRMIFTFVVEVEEEGRFSPRAQYIVVALLS
jgi:hypothetical protein